MTVDVETPEAVGVDAARLERIAPAMQRYVDEHGFAGISTLLARHGRVVHRAQAGWQDREARIPLAADTIFRIYSMTKPVICTALMLLHEEGRFQLFDPVAKFLPAFGTLRVLTGTGDGAHEEALARPITIRDLCTHTAGLTYDFLEESPVGALYRQARLLHDAGRSLEEFVRELARLPLAFQPGSRWHYSVGIDVLAHLIEVISDRPLGAFLEERLFAPLGMIDTGFAVPPAKRDRVAAMYGLPDLAGVGMTLGRLFAAWQGGFNERIDVAATYPMADAPTFARGGHGLFSTADDYLRFAQLLLDRGTLDGTRLLGRKTIDLLCLNHLPPALIPYALNGVPQGGFGFGLGSRVLLDVAASAVPGSVGSFGWGGAAKTHFWVDPQEGLVGILMAQYMAGFALPEKDFQVLAYQALAD